MIEVVRRTGERIWLRYDPKMLGFRYLLYRKCLAWERYERRYGQTPRSAEELPRAREKLQDALEMAYDAELCAEQIMLSAQEQNRQWLASKQNNTPYASLSSVSQFGVVEALIPLLEGSPWWDQRYEIAWYVGRCCMAGFAQTHDQMRLCAERYIAGKRKITPPGTRRRKVAAKRMREVLANTPVALLEAVTAVVHEQTKAVDQYKSGVEKALNALVGGVMKRHKSDPAIVRELLIKKIAGEI